MNLTTINWYNLPVEYISLTEYNNKINYIKYLEGINKLRKIENTFVRHISYFLNTYQLIHRKSGDGSEIRIWIEGEGIHRFVFAKNVTDMSSQLHPGRDCFYKLNDKYKELHQDSKSLIYRFSGTRFKDVYFAIKSCVPVQVNYARRSKEICHNGYKADVSACFASEVKYGLPTLHKYKKLNGLIKPNQDYPFAFYIKSGHIAIYNEFCTADWKLSPFYKDYYANYKDLYFNSSDEITILCKRSDIDLYDVFQYFYNHRLDIEDSKLIMNASIGYFHKNHDPSLSHLAAVIIGRSVNDMLKRANQLVKEGNVIELIATDSILWQGKASSVAINEKHMGAFVLEESNIKYCIRSKKCYQYIDKYNNLITRFAGCNKETVFKYKFGDILNLKSVDLMTKEYMRVGDYYEEVAQK